MNRKEGIDYFPVKCAADNAIELVTAECGLKAHAVIYSGDIRSTWLLL